MKNIHNPLFVYRIWSYDIYPTTFKFITETLLEAYLNYWIN